MDWVLLPPPTTPGGISVDPTKRLDTYTVTVPPTGDVLDAATVRVHCRLAADDPMAPAPYLALLVGAAVDYAEKRLNAALLPQTIAATFHDTGVVSLPRGPFIGIESVVDAAGVPVAYTTEPSGNRLLLSTAATRPATVTYRAGYVDGMGNPAVPSAIKVAILEHVATLVANRESIAPGQMVAVPHALEHFYTAYKRGLRIR